MIPNQYCRLFYQVFYVGVDVGTASVRAALVTREGLLKTTAEEPITIWKPQPEHYVQSSTEIWQKCCSVVKVGSSLCKRWSNKKTELVSKDSILDEVFDNRFIKLSKSQRCP
uniref:Carbohydrate kinase FGGY N-terminal domain-containing protein n=1 Tax=Xiphophorus couchianus TaxID=32473 RepID=A0A3B5LK34_9TELE